MSDETERRLRAARHALPSPTPEETAGARAAALGAGPSRARRRPRLLLAAALAATVASAFGAGYAVASRAGGEPAPPDPAARLNAGPGFLPAEGWEVAATGELHTLRAPVAVAANVPLSPEDRTLESLPAATARRLGPNGVLFHATFYPAGATGAPERLLPLQLRDAEAIGSFEGMPPVGSTRRLVARVGRYDVDVLVVFGAASPAPAVAAVAAQQLARLAVPACPAALPLAEPDRAAAEAFVLRWLGTHYQGDPADLRGARAEAALGAAMPRGGAARAACGAAVAARTMEVGVVLPRVERVSASLSQLSFFVSRTDDGWTVWQRIH